MDKFVELDNILKLSGITKLKENSMANDTMKMAQLTKHLAILVGEMSKIYENNPWLNDIQPQSFEQVIAMSLDEWVLELEDAARDWSTISAGRGRE